MPRAWNKYLSIVSALSSGAIWTGSRDEKCSHVNNICAGWKMRKINHTAHSALFELIIKLLNELSVIFSIKADIITSCVI